MPSLIIDCQVFPDICDETEKFLCEILCPLFTTLGIEGDVTIKIGDESESRLLNRTYRQKDSATDVLSFTLDDVLPDGSRYWGDIHIALPIARKQSLENGHSLLNELLTLSVHGLLHLSGMDHETDQGQMLARQADILKQILPPGP